MGYRLNRLDEPIFTAVSKPLLTEFGIHHILESCVPTTIACIVQHPIFGQCEMNITSVISVSGFVCGIVCLGGGTLASNQDCIHTFFQEID